MLRSTVFSIRGEDALEVLSSGVMAFHRIIPEAVLRIDYRGKTGAVRCVQRLFSHPGEG